MIRLRQLLAVYLAVTFVLAGAAGLTPLLHHWIEHGGHGAPHLHHGPAPTLPGGRAANEVPAASGDVLRVRLKGSAAQGHQPFTLPKLSPRWLHELSHWLANHPEEPIPSESSDAPGHQHHSLAQTLASGLIEAPVAGPLFALDTPTVSRRLTDAHSPFFPRELDLHSAGRAPPTSRG